MNPGVDQIKSVNHHLRLAVDQVGEGVLIVETEASHPLGPRIVFANRAGASLTGYDVEDLVGQPIGTIYDSESLEALVARLPAVARAGKVFQMEKLCQRKDAPPRPFRWTIRGVQDESAKTVNFIMTLRPATVEPPAGQEEDRAGSNSGSDEEDRLEQNIEKSRVESLALLAGGIAHDFNNVLTTIVSNLSLAKLETPPHTVVRSHIEDAIEASQNAQSLAQQILDFTKGRTPMIQNVDPGKMLRQVAKLSTMGSNVRCDIHVAEDLWGVEVDLRQIRQVIHNLMINACQAMKLGGVIQASAENAVVHADTNLPIEVGPYVVLSIRDRGCGIPADDLGKIFEPYFTTKKSGTGIGLATCRTIVQRHHGTITVQSKVNVGTEFRVFLPAARLLERVETVRPQAGAGINGNASGHAVISGDGRILVVDDQDNVRLAAERMLEKLGYRTISAADGQQAINIYRQHTHSSDPITAVLLDMTLPGGLCGDEVMEEIRKMDDHALVIATSGWFDEDAEERFISDGYAGVLPKPYAVEKLSQKLHEALKLRQAS